MRIILHPQRSEERLDLSKVGDALVVNGVTYDFSMLPDGATLPADAIESPFFCDPVERIDGELVVRLTFPIGPEPSAEQAFPNVIQADADGPISLPQDGKQGDQQ